ncbi:MAG: glycosyltransferase family 4 protein [Verrucomicrobiota bacterium JB022]|nr:glycosyltransferase family 4 protein [Verrucomicrobiota bacterium JB022]
MRIAQVHYHLKRGGVTRVIENAVAALDGRGVDIVALCGEPYDGNALPKVQVVEGLAYQSDYSAVDPAALAQRMQAAAREALGGDPDVWHIHNHSLGKNVVFLEVLHRLLAEGAKVLLQIHDFAEDGRPTNYRRQAEVYDKQRDIGTLGERLYPAGAQVHYAVLNARDFQSLQHMGVPEDRLHLLPNPVSVPDLEREPEGETPFPDAKQVFVYPTRAIRRKNVGECLLLSLLAPAGSVIALTLSPANPEWQPIYNRWQAFAQEQMLPVEFGVGEREQYTFAGLIHRADALLTTSVAEGFGLAFLEPYLFGKGVVGRDLPAITQDFKQHGIEFPGLYERLEVPLGIVGEGPLRIQLEKELKSYFASYGHRAPKDAVDRAVEASVRNKRIDFGVLSETFQERVITQLRANPTMAADLRRPALEPVDPKVIARNQKLIAKHYSLPAYGERLQGIYTGLSKASPSEIGSHDATALLASFLDPAKFSLLRV